MNIAGVRKRKYAIKNAPDKNLVNCNFCHNPLNLHPHYCIHEDNNYHYLCYCYHISFIYVYD